MIRVEIATTGLDSFTQGIFEEIAEQVRDALQDFRCPVHGAEGQVIIRVKEDVIEPVACCDAGQEIVNSIVAGMGEEEAEEG